MTFSYGGARKALDDLNLVIRPGEKSGDCRPFGAGKSTLVSCFCGCMISSEGRILIDGHDIAGIQQESLRAQIAW